MRDTTGNLPQMPGIFLDYRAPVVRNAPDGVRELVLPRWSMPSSQVALMEATKERAAKLEEGQAGRFQGIAADGTRQRHHEYPQCQKQALATMARA
jgi:hypothetical protein